MAAEAMVKRDSERKDDICGDVHKETAFRGMHVCTKRPPTGMHVCTKRPPTGMHGYTKRPPTGMHGYTGTRVLYCVTHVETCLPELPLLKKHAASKATTGADSQKSNGLWLTSYDNILCD